MKRLLAALDNLGLFVIGRDIKNTYNIDCPENWFLLYTDKNYFMFSRTEECVTVLKMYSEKQDFYLRFVWN